MKAPFATLNVAKGAFTALGWSEGQPRELGRFLAYLSSPETCTVRTGPSVLLSRTADKSPRISTQFPGSDLLDFFHVMIIYPFSKAAIRVRLPAFGRLTRSSCAMIFVYDSASCTNTAPDGNST